jgi:uncharacterized protein (TIGR02594 family)
MNRAYELALADVGTLEVRGPGHNPKILEYFKDAGFPAIQDDETAWCAAAMGAWLKRAGYRPSGKLTARSYLDWGDDVPRSEMRKGDILIFARGSSTWQGHVTFLHRDAGTFLECLGGNQQNSVNIGRYQKSKLLGVRRVSDKMLLVPPKSPSFGLKTIAGVAGTGAALTAISFWDQLSNIFK